MEDRPCDLGLSGSRGQSVEEVGNVMHMFMYQVEQVTGRARQWREGGLMVATVKGRCLCMLLCVEGSLVLGTLGDQVKSQERRP